MRLQGVLQGRRLRSPGRRAPCPCGRPERLHRPRHTRHRGRGI